MAEVGSASSKLVVLRGNSGSGKTSIAHSLRRTLPSGVLAIISQDVLRREILQVRDGVGNPSIELIDLTARLALNRGLDVIVEGVLWPKWYAGMIGNLASDHRGTTRCYVMDVPFEETLVRHQTKPKAAEFGEQEMREWWYDIVPMPELDERVIPAASTLPQSVSRIRDDCGWTDRPGS